MNLGDRCCIWCLLHKVHSIFVLGTWHGIRLHSNWNSHRLHRSRHKELHCTYCKLPCYYHRWVSFVFWFLEGCFLENGKLSFLWSIYFQLLQKSHCRSNTHRHLHSIFFTVRIEFFCTFIKFEDKVSATSWIRIMLAWRFINWHNLRINKTTINHILVSAGLQSTETHNSIPNNNALKVNLLSLSIFIIHINKNSQVRDVLSCIGLSSNKEIIFSVLRIFVKEIEQSIEVVICCFGIIVLVVGL